MKHYNAKERRNVILQFTLWFFAAIILVAITVYSYSKIDLVETESLRAQYSSIAAAQDQSSSHQDKMDKIVDAAKSLQVQYNNLQANALEMKQDVMPNLENAVKDLKDSKEIINPMANKSISPSDSALYVVSEEYSSLVEKLMDLNSKYFNKITDLEDQLEEKNSELRDKKDELKELQNDLRDCRKEID